MFIKKHMYILSWCQFSIFPQWNRILSMKNYFYRSLAHVKHNQDFQKVEQTPDQMNQILDQKLHYMNRSFKHNLQIQQIFLDLIKTKRTLHSKQIKEYYKLFTENKADSEIFHNAIQQPIKQNIEQFLHIKEANRSLKRLYCRLIQKIMVKISFYMMNKQNLGFLYKQVNEMMKRCETLIRRINYMRDLNSINDLIEEIYRQNEEMQIKIIQQLIDKGFIISIDEFYRINGVDLVDKELYERVKSELAEDSDSQSNEQQLKEKLQSIKKFEFNLNKKTSLQRMRKEESNFKRQKNNKPVHRVGYMQIENKYRDLLVHLENLINNDLVDQIAEEKDEGACSESDIKEKQTQEQSAQAVGTAELQVLNSQSSLKQQQTNLSLRVSEQIVSSSEAELNQQKIKISSFVEGKETKSRQQIKKMITSSSNLNAEVSHLEHKSQLRQKKITLESSESNSYISDIMNNRGSRANSNSRKKSHEFFSKSFINAIKTIDKVNLSDKSDKLAIKRMSQHIMAFHKQSEHSNSDAHRISNAVNLNNVLRRNHEKKSIIKLINIYKSRKFQEEIHSMQRQFDDYKDKIIKEENTNLPDTKPNKVSIFYQESKVELKQITEEKTITNITNYPKIIDHKQPMNETAKSNKYQRNPVFTNLPKDIKLCQNVSHQLMKNLDAFKAKIRLTSNIRTPAFENARLSHRLQAGAYKMQSPVNSPAKLERVKMQANSLLTSKGIQTIDHERFQSYACERKDKVKMYKTAVVTPMIDLSSRAGRFEVYDRKRRVILP